MGVHHAREWPSGEHAMEWAYELINGYKGGDARATNIVRRAATSSCRSSTPTASTPRARAGRRPAAATRRVDDTVYIAGASTGGEYRRKNCRVGDDRGGAVPDLGRPGRDRRRPEPQLRPVLGRPGRGHQPARPRPTAAPAPFSEPETRNIQWLVSRNQVMTLITNHTTAGLVLRAPGLAALGDPVDENRGYKALGDAMAKQNGYFSQKGFELYDTTGTTEDWSYNATGGFGFTFEIYCGAPNYETGDCDDPAFHPLFATMVKEWDGTSAQADHVDDPAARPRASTARATARPTTSPPRARSTRRGTRVIEGAAPAGATLRLTKAFKTDDLRARAQPRSTTGSRRSTTSARPARSAGT